VFPNAIINREHRTVIVVMGIPANSRILTVSNPRTVYLKDFKPLL